MGNGRPHKNIHIIVIRRKDNAEYIWGFFSCLVLFRFMYILNLKLAINVGECNLMYMYSIHSCIQYNNTTDSYCSFTLINICFLLKSSFMGLLFKLHSFVTSSLYHTDKQCKQCS